MFVYVIVALAISVGLDLLYLLQLLFFCNFFPPTSVLAKRYSINQLVIKLSQAQLPVRALTSIFRKNFCRS